MIGVPISLLWYHGPLIYLNEHNEVTRDICRNIEFRNIRVNFQMHIDADLFVNYKIYTLALGLILIKIKK